MVRVGEKGGGRTGGVEPSNFVHLKAKIEGQSRKRKLPVKARSDLLGFVFFKIQKILKIIDVSIPMSLDSISVFNISFMQGKRLAKCIGIVLLSIVRYNWKVKYLIPLAKVSTDLRFPVFLSVFNALDGLNLLE